MPYAVAADGVRIAYRVHGREQVPLLLLAGQASSGVWWDGVRPDFEAAGRCTVTVDYRGTGDSDKPDAPYSTEEFAADAVAVLDALGAGRADVYGTSMGGRTAQWLAARYPGRVRRLVLGCTSPGGPHAVERDDALRTALAQHGPEAVRVLEELMYTPQWLAAHPGPYRTTGDPRTPPHARRRHRLASSRHDAWDVLPAVTAPTLVVHGTDDVFNPAANAPLLAARVPGARLELIPGARHAYFEEFRAVASPLVLDFLA